MGITKWNENADFIAELETDGHQVVDLTHDITNEQAPILGKLAPQIQKLGGHAELIVNFNSKGYNDPGSMYGGSDNLGYPPEGDDERTPNEAYLKSDKNKIPLDPKLTEALFDHYIDQIMDTELPESEPDPGPESRYDQYEQVQRLANFITEDPNIFNE